MADEKIIDKIKKMLALANCSGATDGERDTAMQMVNKLLVKHNINMTRVEAQGETEKRESNEASFVVYPWARNIASSIAELFFCKYYFMRNWNGKQATHVFVGKTSNSLTTQYMADFVVRSVLREASKRYGSAISPEARSFAVGVARQIGNRVHEIKANAGKDEEATTPGSALMVLNMYKSELAANEHWLEVQGVTLKSSADRTKSSVIGSAYHAGRDFGSKVSLAPQVGASRSKTLQLK